MRIIAGEAKGRTLYAPPGSETRPTSDKIRGSLFNIIGSRVADARVLDLFGGTGALALEALSRGAELAVIADNSRAALQVIDRNARNVLKQDFEYRVSILGTDYRSAIGALEGRIFDLVFLDPPYRMDTAPICQAIVERGLLKRDGTIIVEHGRETPPHIAPPLRLCDHREYGAAGLGFYRLREEEEAP